MPRKPGKKNPIEKLHSRWVNIHDKNTKKMDEEKEVFEILNTENFDELENMKCWLANNFEPWAEVCDKWEKTAPIRIPKFLATVARTFEGMATFYQLIDIDFLKLFPSKQNSLLTEYDDFCHKILLLFQLEIKDKQSKILLNTLKEKPMDKNSQHCITATFLHSTLLPKRIAKTYKPTILEAQIDFVIHIHTINDLEPKLEGIRKYFRANKQPIQPRIIVIGTSLENLKEFFVFLDK